jgi:hypothetical protein
MVSTSSLFSQLLSLIDRVEFQRLVIKHKAEKRDIVKCCGREVPFGMSHS